MKGHARKQMGHSIIYSLFNARFSLITPLPSLLALLSPFTPYFSLPAHRTTPSPFARLLLLDGRSGSARAAWALYSDAPLRVSATVLDMQGGPWVLVRARMAWKGFRRLAPGRSWGPERWRPANPGRHPRQTHRLP